MKTAEIEENETTALAIVDKIDAKLVFQGEGMEPLLVKLEEFVRSIVNDVDTEEGRADMKSLAHRVAKSKTALEKVRKGMVAGWTQKTKAVNEKGKVARDRLDALRDEVKQPVVEWEQAQAKKAAAAYAAQQKAEADRIAKEKAEEEAARAKVVAEQKAKAAALKIQEDALAAREAELARSEHAAKKAISDANLKAAEAKRVADEAAAKVKAAEEATAKAEKDAVDAKATAEKEIADRMREEVEEARKVERDLEKKQGGVEETATGEVDRLTREARARAVESAAMEEYDEDFADLGADNTPMHTIGRSSAELDRSVDPVAQRPPDSRMECRPPRIGSGPISSDHVPREQIATAEAILDLQSHGFTKREAKDLLKLIVLGQIRNLKLTY